MQIASKKISRKDILKMGILGSAAVALPFERVARTQLSAVRLPENQLPTPFQTPFVVPPVAQPVYKDETTDYYEMTMRQGFHQLIPGLPKTEIWGYEGITPGPTIMARRGRDVVVRHKNWIQSSRHEHASVHLHGNASAPQYDGYANDTTRPGEYKDYRYPNGQDARTLWYHDHGVHVTALNAYMGLAGLYISHDDHEMDLPIPKGKYDVPVVLKDAIFGTDGQLIFDDAGHSSLFGDVILANGSPWPVMKVERRKYRFRFLNASISRGFNLALSGGGTMKIIGHDGGLAPAPVEVRNFRLGMAERLEVVIDFANYRVGEQVTLRNLGVPNTADFALTDRVMRFDVVGEASDTSDNEVPQSLGDSDHPYNPMKLQESQAVRTRRLAFGRDIVGGKEMWTVAVDGAPGQIWDPNRVDIQTDHDEIEIWEFVNNGGGWFHPIHVHLVDFKILDRDGQPPHPWERGPKDVAYVGEGETVRVIMKFGPQRGRYMIHCHNLVHEDHDMMAQFEVGTDGPSPLSLPARPTGEAPPLYTPKPDNEGPGGGGSGNPAPNAAPVVSLLRPANGSVTRDRTPSIVARITDDKPIDDKRLGLYVDGRRVPYFDFRRDRSGKSGVLTYTCRTMRLGWHWAQVIARDAEGRQTSRSVRFRVVRR